MQVDTSGAVAAVVAVVGALWWLFRLQSRIDVLESVSSGLRVVTDGLKADIQYIRQRIDEALNKHE